MRALPKERPETLTLPPDGNVLEDVIGELQSVWGVPQYPQEYRITVKVAEERDQRSEPANAEAQPDAIVDKSSPDSPKREKAPAAPMLRGPGEQPQRERAPARKRRRRRRRGGGGGGGADSGGAPGGNGS